MDSDPFEAEATTIATGTPAPTPGTRRFATGSIIAGRYRLVALLGRGGMGEVYRAEDLTLDQPIALKFLPDAVAGDAARLTQFHNELRTARQVSHKNVVRLHDLGEADGRPFITMEYVDGEDLASLLRRIGRLPQDKAVDVARQLCAGVAAAHERGVLHRDLKPANVMLDGDGNVRITDFGIATAAADAGAEIAGTPQYMAPELLRGGPASIGTDLYALGLILFELFTGRRAFDAPTLAQLKVLHDTNTIVTPSSIVRDLDPSIERVILRAIDRDPARRPASALAIAAALPGGNPLAEALAAGETPSPDMLAAAGETDAISVAGGLTLLAALAAALGAYALLSPRVTVADLMPLDRPPAVLADRAEQMLASFGYPERPGDTAEGFSLSADFTRWIADRDQTIGRWSPARVAGGPAMVYWFRDSPRELQPERPSFLITQNDPPHTVTGMNLVTLDTRGRLQQFHHVPPQHDPAAGPVPAPPWSAAFEAAGLSMPAFTPVDPEWTPRDFADARAAWEGPSADFADVRLRVEAAAYRGRLVSFYLVGPWTRPARMQPLAQSRTNRVLGTFAILLWLTVLGSAALLAQLHLRANRADRRSAARLAMLSLAVTVAGWAIGAHHVTAVSAEAQSLFTMLSGAAFNAGLLWIVYLALEPYGRRFWPDGLVGWTRLFSGRVRDPRIGREILVGAALGGAMLLIDVGRGLAPLLIGHAPGVPAVGFDVSTLIGPARTFVSWTQQFYSSVQTSLIVTMIFVGLRLIVRRTWIAVVVGLVVVSAAAVNNMPYGGVPWLDAAAQLAAVGLITFAIYRFGLLVTTVMMAVDNIPTAVPLVTGGPAWAAMPGHMSILLVAALACFGYYAARAGQPLFGTIGGQA